MKKDYTLWNKIKTSLNNDKKRPYFHPREIWFCKLGLNVGFEQDGSGGEYLRPILILKKFNDKVCLIVPLTKSKKKGLYYFSFTYQPNVISVAILSQIRLIDVQRLEYLSGYISKNDFKRIKEKIRQLIT